MNSIRLMTYTQYHYEYCGIMHAQISNLVATPCFRHPDGPNKGKHKLYEGTEKAHCNCIYCGTSTSSIANLTSIPCFRHPKDSKKRKTRNCIIVIN